MRESWPKIMSKSLYARSSHFVKPPSLPTRKNSVSLAATMPAYRSDEYRPAAPRSKATEVARGSSMPVIATSRVLPTAVTTVPSDAAIFTGVIRAPLPPATAYPKRRLEVLTASGAVAPYTSPSDVGTIACVISASTLFAPPEMPRGGGPGGGSGPGRGCGERGATAAASTETTPGWSPSTHTSAAHRNAMLCPRVAPRVGARPDVCEIDRPMSMSTGERGFWSWLLVLAPVVVVGRVSELGRDSSTRMAELRTEHPYPGTRCGLLYCRLLLLLLPASRNLQYKFPGFGNTNFIPLYWYPVVDEYYCRTVNVYSLYPALIYTRRMGACVAPTGKDMNG